MNHQRFFPAMDPSKQHQVIIVISAHLSNPNGDPDSGNTPRVNPYSGHGIISAVSIKRRIRDYVGDRYSSVPGMGILIREGSDVNGEVRAALRNDTTYRSSSVEIPGNLRTALSQVTLPTTFALSEERMTWAGRVTKRDLGILQRGLVAAGGDAAVTDGFLAAVTATAADPPTSSTSSCELISRTYWDARIFGFTAPESAGRTRGPVQITDAESISPIRFIEQTVTHSGRRPREGGPVSGFGWRTVVDHAVYVTTAFVSGPLAQRQNVSERDLEVLLEGIWHGFDHARSSGRADVRVEGMVVLSHSSPFGSLPYSLLTDRLHISHDSRYDVSIDFDRTGIDTVDIGIISKSTILSLSK